jgi:hypothetical protein
MTRRSGMFRAAVLLRLILAKPNNDPDISRYATGPPQKTYRYECPKIDCDSHYDSEEELTTLRKCAKKGHGNLLLVSPPTQKESS